MGSRLALRLVVPALALGAALGGCSGDNGKDTVGQASPTPASACPAGPASTDLTKKPTVVLPAGATLPAATTSTDVVVGKGAVAKSGSRVSVKYVGALFSTCEQFDSSWDRGQDFDFVVGGDVVAGFTKGVTGMRVGGRRTVVIPAVDGYGDQAVGTIPPGSTLVFVIDLVAVR